RVGVLRRADARGDRAAAAGAAGDDQGPHSSRHVETERQFAALRMTTEHQQEQASLYVLGALAPAEQQAFEAELRGNAALRELVRGLQRAASSLAIAAPEVPLPAGLKDKVLRRVESAEKLKVPANAAAIFAGHRFVPGAEQTGWK